MDAWLANLSNAGWRQCWQVTLLIVAVWLTVRVVGRNRPHLACVLWLLVLVKCLTPPIWSSPSGIFCWLERSHHIESQTTADTVHKTLKTPRITDLPPGSEDDEADAVSVQLNSQPKINDSSGESTPFNNQSSNAPRKFWSASTLLWLTLATWLTGCVASLLITTTRLWLCWRSLRLTRRVTDPELERLLTNLCTQISLRRPVTLWITNSRIGPAVVGLWRPIVILPSVLVRNKKAQELTPLLAHELVHIRRGDLWLGLLQLLAQTLWWFHPLVRLACRWLTREAERCCDEAVIAHLSCTPAAYARGLLDVVALKQQLQPLPSFPGVRPVDVTRGRLERIMKLRQGCRKQTPWWCWVVLALTAAVILPGAAMVLGSRETTSHQFLTEPRADLVNSNRIAVNQFEVDDLGGEQDLLIETYDVEDLFIRLIGERKETAAAAREHLAAIVQSSAPGPWEIRNEVTARQATTTDAGGFDREAKLGDDEAKRSLSWTDEGLVVRQTAAGHERIQRQLAALRKHGFSELTVEVRILSGPLPAIDQIATKWKLIGATAEDEWGTESRPLIESRGREQEPQAGDAGHIRGTVESIIEKQVPAVIAFLDHEETHQILELAQNNSRTNILSAPKVVVFNGQSARIVDTTQRPFVVGVKPTPSGGQEPQIRVVSEGTTIRLRPELKDDDSVQLDLSLILSHIRGVETAEFAHGPGSTPLTVQVPEVGMTKLKSTVDMKFDQTLAISLPSATVGNKFKGGCILVNVRRSSDDSRQAGGPRTIEYSVAPASHSQPIASGELSKDRLIEKIYPVADLVVPIPGEPMVVYLLGAKPATPWVNSTTTPDFESLIELLTTTVASKSWKQNGGDGTITGTNHFSVFICNTEEVHAQVANCLESLHRLQDTQICWGVEVFSAKPGDFAKWASSRNDESLTKLAHSRRRLAALSPDSVQSLSEKVASKEAIVSPKDRIHSLKVTGFLGQAPDFRFPSKEACGLDLISRAQFQATMSSSLRSMRVMLGIHGANSGVLAEDEPTWSEPFNLPRGHSVLFDLDPATKPETTSSTAPALRRLLLLTPRVIIATNEEYVRTLIPVGQ